MNYKNIALFTFLLVVLTGLSMSAVSAVHVPTKYKTEVLVNKYHESDSYYSDGYYVWNPTKSSFSMPYILETYGGSQTKIRFSTYNNYGKYKWTDVRSSTLTVNYKIVTSTKTYYATKTVRYTNIPKYGMTKTLVFKGPPKSHVLIYYMSWTQVHRFWYGQ